MYDLFNVRYKYLPLRHVGVPEAGTLRPAGSREREPGLVHRQDPPLPPFRLWGRFTAARDSGGWEKRTGTGKKEMLRKNRDCESVADE
jgi:hypothetical protein